MGRRNRMSYKHWTFVLLLHATSWLCIFCQGPDYSDFYEGYFWNDDADIIYADEITYTYTEKDVLPKPRTCETTENCIMRVHQYTLCAIVNVTKMADDHVTATSTPEARCVCDRRFGYYRNGKTCRVGSMVGEECSGRDAVCFDQQARCLSDEEDRWRCVCRKGYVTAYPHELSDDLGMAYCESEDVDSRLGRSIPELHMEVENMIGARMASQVPLTLGEEITLGLLLPPDAMFGSIRIERCLATLHSNMDVEPDNVAIPMLIDGCPYPQQKLLTANTTWHPVQGSVRHFQTGPIKTFQIGTGNAFIHCRVKLCVHGAETECLPVKCPARMKDVMGYGRKKRSATTRMKRAPKASESGGSHVNSVYTTVSRELIIAVDIDYGSVTQTEDYSMMLVAGVLVALAFLVMVLLAMGLLVTKRLKKKRRAIPPTPKKTKESKPAVDQKDPESKAVGNGAPKTVVSQLSRETAPSGAHDVSEDSALETSPACGQPQSCQAWVEASTVFNSSLGNIIDSTRDSALSKDGGHVILDHRRRMTSIEDESSRSLAVEQAPGVREISYRLDTTRDPVHRPGRQPAAAAAHAHFRREVTHRNSVHSLESRFGDHKLLTSTPLRNQLHTAAARTNGDINRRSMVQDMILKLTKAQCSKEAPPKELQSPEVVLTLADIEKSSALQLEDQLGDVKVGHPEGSDRVTPPGYETIETIEESAAEENIRVHEEPPGNGRRVAGSGSVSPATQMQFVSIIYVDPKA